MRVDVREGGDITVISAFQGRGGSPTTSRFGARDSGIVNQPPPAPLSVSRDSALAKRGAATERLYSTPCRGGGTGRRATFRV